MESENIFNESVNLHTNVSRLVNNTYNSTDNLTVESLTTAGSKWLNGDLEQWQFDIGYDMLRVVFPLTFIIGATGNTFSIIVMNREALRSLSTGVYLSGLAVSDTCVILTNILFWWVSLVGGLNMFNEYPFACKMHNFGMQYFSSCSAWLVVGVSIDRFIAVNFPYQTSRLCTPYRARLATIFVYVANAGIWLSEFWFWDVRNLHCTLVPEHYDLLANYLIYIRLAIENLLPSFLLVLLNIGIVVALIRQKKQFSAMSASNQSGMEKRIKKTTVLVLATSTMYLILTLPYHCQYAYMVVMTDARRVYSIPDMVQLVLRFLGYGLLMVNHSTNFFIYVLCGERFRKEFLLVITGCCPAKVVEKAEIQIKIGNDSAVATGSEILSSTDGLDKSVAENGI